MKVAFCFALLCVCIAGALAFTCSTCDLSRCSKIKCRFGETKDACDCCPMCYKGAGETCGGDWNIYGRCASPLSCIRFPSLEGGTTEGYEFHRPGRCLALP